MIKTATHTSGLLDAQHVQGMLDGMEEANCFDITVEHDGQKITSVIATIGKKSKEVFRALIGTTGMYLVRHDNRLFL